MTRTDSGETLSMIEEERAESLELGVGDESDVVGRTVGEGVPELPASVGIGSSTRDGELIIPRGDSQIEISDRLVVFVEADDAEAVAAKL